MGTAEEIARNECINDSFHVKVFNKHICVRHDMVWDCQERAAMTDSTHATTAMPHLPQGPAECSKCAMIGTQTACIACKEGFWLDDKTSTCMKHEDKNHDMPVVKTNVAECPSEMEPFCKVCHEGHFDNNGTQEFVRECLVCREGFIKGSKGNCYSESDHSAGE
jgi:hypothetical protein